MIPLQLGMVPLYQLMRDANLLRTYTSLIIFQIGHHLLLTIFLCTGFVRALIWNDYLTPMLYVGGSAQQTLPVSIFSFRGEFATQWGPIFAGMALAIIPIMIIYLLLQKYIIRGFASGLRG